jgi:hypothetical protein
VLSIIAGHERKPSTVVPGAPASQSGAPSAPAAPPANSGGGVLNQLQGGSGPQVPQSK